ncbi:MULTISPECIES: CBS domain-containing protein [unclassified Streptomyces]|uniref:CBS domain-containing protein n=1 Tax=unclassified Streptomyces TaxID=2593676 RepID=UPI00336A66F9
MAQRVRDVMADVPMTVAPQEPVTSVARLMRDHGVSAVLVMDRDRLRGLVTDRDLVVRALADGADPEQTTVIQAVNEDLVAVSADDEVDHAIKAMREHSLPRLPVVDGDGKPIGSVCLGDLATDENSEPRRARVVAPTPDLHGGPEPG